MYREIIVVKKRHGKLPTKPNPLETDRIRMYPVITFKIINVFGGQLSPLNVTKKL